MIEATKAYTQGILYDLPSVGYPAMAEGLAKVKGFLLTFADEEVLEGLDLLEDYDPRRSPSLNEYNRQKVPIYDLQGNLITEAWTYFMSEAKIAKKGGVIVPSGNWRE